VRTALLVPPHYFRDECGHFLNTVLLHLQVPYIAIELIHDVSMKIVYKFRSDTKKYELHLSGSGCEAVTGFCEHSDETSGGICWLDIKQN
jgi:hypothetical protein